MTLRYFAIDQLAALSSGSTGCDSAPTIDPTPPSSIQNVLSRLYIKHLRKSLTQAAPSSKTRSSNGGRKARGFLSRLVSSFSRTTVSEHGDATKAKENDSPSESFDSISPSMENQPDSSITYDEVIPSDVKSLARFHLSSIGNRYYATQNSFRKTCCHAQNKTTSADQKGSPMWSIIGIGEVSEVTIPASLSGSSHLVHTDDSNDVAKQLAPTVMETSDRKQLLDQFQSNESAGLLPSLQYTQCCALSPNCIAISWGLDDGIVVLYRKVQILIRKEYELRWDAVAIITPDQDIVYDLSQRLVDRNEAKFDGKPSFLMNNKRQDEMIGFESGLLRVSGIAPMHFESAQNDPSASVIAIAISRVGGYLELLVLPRDLCDGPILTPRMSKTDKKYLEAGHYATGLRNVCEIEGSSSICVSSIPHHSDITAIAIHKTHIEKDIVWDDTKYPDGPPVEFVLAASGSTLTDDKEGYESSIGDECVSLWGVTLIQSIDAKGSDESSCSFHIDFLQKLHIPYKNGPVMKTFIEGTPSIGPTIGEISCTFPISSLEFASEKSDINNDPLNKSKVLISISDFNGRMFIADCSSVIDAATKPRFDFQISKHIIKLGFEYISPDDTNKPIIDHTWWNSNHGLCSVSLHANGLFSIYQVLLEVTEPKIRLQMMSSFSMPCYDLTVAFWKNFSMKDMVPFVLQYANSCSSQLCCITEYTPMNVMQSYIGQKQYKKALHIASKAELNVANTSSMNNCYIYLWERDYDLIYLKEIRDDAYVINVASRVQELSLKARSISLDDIREILCEAVKRMRKKDTTVRWQHDFGRFRSILHRLGTYLILCNASNNKTQSTKKFFEKMMRDDAISSLAVSLASRCDIESLKILFLRHWDEIGSNTRKIEILDFLPWATEIHTYEILLPSLKRNDARILLTEHCDELCMSPFLDEHDKDIVFGARETNDHDCDEYRILRWYLNKAKAIERKTGQLDYVEDICNMAIHLCSPLPPDVNEDVTRALNDLILLRTRASILKQILISQRRMSKRHECVNIHLDQFEKMNSTEVIGLILESCSAQQSVNILDKFFYETLQEASLQVEYENSWFMGEALHLREGFERATISYCMHQVRKAIPQAVNTINSTSSELILAISLCLEFAESSKTSIAKAKRFIQDEKALMRFFLEFVEVIGRCMSSVLVRSKVSDFYECLPLRVVAIEEKNVEWQYLSDKIDAFHRSLVCLEVLLSWSNIDDNVLQYHIPLQQWFNQSGETHDSEDFSIGILVFISNAFYEQWKVSTAERRASLYIQFLADIRDVNDYCTQNRMPLDRIYQNCTLPFIKEELSAWNGVGCHTSLYPTLAKDFETFENFQVISNFFVQTLKVQKSMLPTFKTFEESIPINFVLSEVEKKPSLVMVGCTGWDDVQFARHTVRTTYGLLFSSSSNVNESNSLPSPLPGDAILHIALKLGLCDARSQLLITNWIVRCATKAGYYDAAATLCMILLHKAINVDEAECSLGREILLRSVASLINCQSYFDTETKTALCRECLKWCKMDYICEVDAIQSHRDLECERFSSTLDNHNSKWRLLISTAALFMGLPERKYFHISADRLGPHTENFLQTCRSLSDIRPNMETITSQFILDHILEWSTAEATSISDFDLFQPRRTFMREMIYLILSSLLHEVGSSWVLASISKSLQALEGVTSNHCVTDVEVPGFVKPDEDIVRQLHGRGYSINGSRRAAVMVKNESFSASLVWAVTHFCDDNFDDPLIFLKESNTEKMPADSTMDEIVLAMLRESLLETKRFMRQNDISVEHLSTTPSIRRSQASYECEQTLADELPQKSAVEHDIQRAKGTDIASGLSDSRAKNMSLLRERGRKLLTDTKRTANASKSNTFKTDKQYGSSRLNLPTKRVENTHVKSHLNNLGADERRRLAEEGRRILRKKGQLGLEERRTFAEQGRRIFQQKTGRFQTQTSTPPPPPLPPHLRSKQNMKSHVQSLS